MKKLNRFSKLFSILITRNDDLIIRPWLDRHYALFDRIAVIDGSDTQYTEQVCKEFQNVIHKKDPEGNITDQTLRAEGFDLLREFADFGDWFFVSHPDEFLIHDPRNFMGIKENLMLWLPLLVLPHPSEKQAFIDNNDFDKIHAFEHFWWGTGKIPHCEYRMWRYCKDPIWDLESTKKSSSVIPINYHDEKIYGGLPLYFHYKCFDLKIDHYSEDGMFINRSRLETGLYHRINNFDDFFFDEARPYGHNYFNFQKFSSTEEIFIKFGNPPRLISTSDGNLSIINSQGQRIY